MGGGGGERDRGEVKGGWGREVRGMTPRSQPARVEEQGTEVFLSHR